MTSMLVGNRLLSLVITALPPIAKLPLTILTRPLPCIVKRSLFVALSVPVAVWKRIAAASLG